MMRGHIEWKVKARIAASPRRIATAGGDRREMPTLQNGGRSTVLQRAKKVPDRAF